MINAVSDSYKSKLNDSIRELLYCCPTLAQMQLSNHVKIMELKKGEIFIRKGEKCEGVYVVLEGVVQLFVTNNHQKTILFFKGAKDVVGLQLAMNDQVFDYSASTMTPVVLAYLPTSELMKMLNSHPSTFFSFMRKIDQKAVTYEKHSALLMTSNAEKIVLNTIKELNQKFGTDVNGYLKFRVSVKDLASYVGLSKTSLYRVLQTLKEKSILSHYLNRYRLEKNIQR